MLLLVFASTASCIAPAVAEREAAMAEQADEAEKELGDCAARLWQHCNYGGYSVCLQPGDYDLSKLEELGANDDDVSSIKVARKTTAILFDDDGFGGDEWPVKGSVHCLSDTPFNDRASSIRVKTK